MTLEDAGKFLIFLALLAIYIANIVMFYYGMDDVANPDRRVDDTLDNLRGGLLLGFSVIIICIPMILYYSKQLNKIDPYDETNLDIIFALFMCALFAIGFIQIRFCVWNKPADDEQNKIGDRNFKILICSIVSTFLLALTIPWILHDKINNRIKKFSKKIKKWKNIAITPKTRGVLKAKGKFLENLESHKKKKIKLIEKCFEKFPLLKLKFPRQWKASDQASKERYYTEVLR
jgi:hypothetical protein